MRVGLSGIGSLRDAHRVDAFGDHDARHFLDVLEKFLEPALEIEAVPQHEVGFLRAHDVERGRLVIVNFRARLGDGFHDRLVAGDVLRDVLNDREGRHHAERLGAALRDRCVRRQRDQQSCENTGAEISKTNPFHSLSSRRSIGEKIHRLQVSPESGCNCKLFARRVPESRAACQCFCDRFATRKGQEFRLLGFFCCSAAVSGAANTRSRARG